MASTSIFRNPGARILFLAASVVVVVAGLRAAGPFLLPLFVAIVLSILSSPLFVWLTRRIPNSLAVLVTVLANLAVLAAMVLLASGSVNSFTRSLPRYQDGLERKASTLIEWLERNGIDTSDLAWITTPDPPPGTSLEQPAESSEGLVSVDGSTDDTTRGAETRTSQFNVGALVDVFVGILRGLALFVSNALVVLLLMIFILVEAPGLPRKLQRAFALTDDEVGRLFTVKNEIQTYLGIKTAVSLATGLLITAWLMLLGVDYAVLWGLIAFLFNYVPSLGSIVAAVPAVVLTWVDVGLSQAALVAVGYLVVNLSLGNIIEPHLMGRQFGLSTMVVVFSLVFWYWLWGPVGALLSVPLTMIIKILLQNTEDLRWLAYLLGPNPREVG